MRTTRLVDDTAKLLDGLAFRTSLDLIEHDGCRFDLCHGGCCIGPGRFDDGKSASLGKGGDEFGMQLIADNDNRTGHWVPRGYTKNRTMTVPD